MGKMIFIMYNKTSKSTSIFSRLKSYFIEMDFYYNEQILGSSFIENKKKWTVAVYALTCAGIFCRQITNFPKVDINFNNLKWTVFIASLIFGFAILPVVMRWISSKNPKPSFEHVISAFGIGFFVDFTDNVIKSYFKL
jgi:hypothetical protein